MSITEWDTLDRPREKLIAQGAGALSNAELLAILIGSGPAGMSAVDVATAMLSDTHNSLGALVRKPVLELKSYKGIGTAKAITLAAAFELGRRRQAEEPDKREPLNSPQRIYDYVRHRMDDADHEQAWLLLLNNRYLPLNLVKLSEGGFTETTVDIRLVMRHALTANATAIALAHNHPSGSPRPSRQDDQLTERVRKASELLRITLIDHIITADNSFYSYMDDGKL